MEGFLWVWHFRFRDFFGVGKLGKYFFVWLDLNTERRYKGPPSSTLLAFFFKQLMSDHRCNGHETEALREFLFVEFVFSYLFPLFNMLASAITSEPSRQARERIRNRAYYETNKDVFKNKKSDSISKLK